MRWSQSRLQAAREAGPALPTRSPGPTRSWGSYRNRQPGWGVPVVVLPGYPSPSLRPPLTGAVQVP